MKKIKFVGVSLLASVLLSGPLAMSTASFVNVSPIIVQAQEEGLTVRVGYGAPHGNQSFGTAVVVLNGETIVDVQLDEFQFVEGDQWVGVPNSDEGFGENYPEGYNLASKRLNSDAYSEMMTEHAGATVTYNDNLDALQDFAIGKTLAELEESIAELTALGEDGNVSDVVSGATLVDSSGYLQLVVDTANNGFEFAIANAENAEIKQTLAAPHGTRSFAIATAVVDGDTVLSGSIDEFQFVEGEDWTGVPNSDGKFGENYPEGTVLVSKLMDSEGYSAMMTENAGSTISYIDNMAAISEFVSGKTIAELEEAVAELEGLGEEGNVADVVSGATLVDAGGYIQAIIDAAQQ
ncbi:peptidoglycan-binding protein [Fundicoccus culcitae]|uniref:Peptidoglycan-binding protein n=1 Tax=Fundicoccus culcitae TaxID=2969821 RepID=A0ABY5P6T7_9LACT|nr:peptidoglycan-binding protein [Fundicoccus culcitae]UUX34143.1 peptidoglycan-binding protein [Fundicoccus culcitae]